MTNLNRRLAAVATGQLGALSRDQAHAVGATDDQLRRRVMSGVLDQSGPNVFRLPGAERTPIAELRALVLDIGGDVIASGYTAAALHGFDGYELRAPFDLTIGRGRCITRRGHRIHTAASLEPIDRGEERGVPTLRAARTLIDLARRETAEQLAAALDSSLRDGRVNEAALHRRIVALRGSGRYGINTLLRVLEGREAISGGHSWLEREFLRLIAMARLPKPQAQAVLTTARDRLVRVDFFFAGTNVVVEVLGYTWHSSKAQLRRDTERLNALLEQGLRPYQFTYEAIVSEPDQVIEDVRRAIGHPPSSSGSVPSTVFRQRKR